MHMADPMSIIKQPANTSPLHCILHKYMVFYMYLYTFEYSFNYLMNTTR